MARVVVRPAGYTGSLQRIVWALGNNVPVTAYLWGGGGGGGGNDSARGGSGGGGGYSVVNFTVDEGDTIEVAVGQGGGGGQSGVSNGAGGTAGASYTTENLFNTIDNTASPPVFKQFNSAYCTFLNTYGVWVNPTSAATFDRTYSVNFPVTGNYQFTACADNSARFFVDGTEFFYADNFKTPYTVGYEVTAGTHSIRILGTNTGGPGAVALTIGQGDSYSGGRGGNSGPSGSSGAGGGGGGSTVVILNGTPIGAAGGGAGGGGGGNQGGNSEAITVFTTLSIQSINDNFKAESRSVYCSFLNDYGIWSRSTNYGTFDQTVNVSFPNNGYYTFTGSCDNSGTIFIDGVAALSMPTYKRTSQSQIYVTGGTHAIRLYGRNTGGPGAIGLTIDGIRTYNTTATGEDAPGARGQAAVGQNAGQNGTNKAGDGGGGGGGGGGWGGGNGGTCQPGDAGGYAGAFGLSSTPSEDPVYRTPGGIYNSYYRSGIAVGGLYGGVPGNSGYAVFEFEVPGTFVHTGGSFQPVIQTYIKVNGSWTPVNSTYIKKDGAWVPINGSYAPVFQDVPGRFGVNPRGGVVETQAADPVDNPGTGDGGGFDGGGGGGGCFLAGTQITMADGTLKSIEDIVVGDIILEALSNKPTKVIGVKTRAHDVSKWVFSLDKKTKPYITEEHPFYNDTDELCAISDLATTLAPWLGPIKIVDVPNKKKIKEAVTVYNLMLETGESHYANGVRVNNIVKTGGTYALVYKGFLDQASYESHVYNEENQTVTPEQQALIFNYTLKLTNYVLRNNNICSKLLGRVLSWALRNRDTLYPYIDRWFKSKLRRWLFRKKV